MQENNLISIQKVSALLKVPKPTLRFWEKELDGILIPLRTEGGQRRYTVENIAVIEEIKKLKSKGMSLPEIKRKLGKGQMSEAGSQTCPQRSRHARHREAQPRRTGLRGGRGSGDERTDSVDLLAARVAEVVKAEVNRFFEGEDDTNE
jgi:DNA-binding transcriptional MerR regulator